jgi:hypothetical protein
MKLSSETSQLDILSRKADNLISAMTQVAEQSGYKLKTMEQRQRRQRAVLIGLISSFALDLAVTTALIFTGAEVRSNSREIDQVQQATRKDVLCPLYGIFLSAEKNPPPPNETPAQAQRRVQAFKVIHEGYAILGCAQVNGNALK